MTDEDKQALAAEIADELEDSGWGIATPDARDKTARLVVDRIEYALYLQGWMPPATYERLHDWAMRTGNIPEHHINRGVLTSHLVELSGILHNQP